jgi:hypothetical protein
MNNFLIKITNRLNVDLILSGSAFVHQDIYNFKDEIKLDDLVFFVFSGDKTEIDWQQGLVGYGKIIIEPYDEGYNEEKKRYFKIKIQPIFVLKNPIPPKYAKIHPNLSLDLYDVPYVGAQHFPNQAIARTDDKGAKALMTIIDEYKNVLYIDDNYERKNFSDVVNLKKITSDFKEAGLNLSEDFIAKVLASLLAKKFLILTGLSGSGKTKVASALATWFSLSMSKSDPFKIGAKILADRITYIVRKSDVDSVEFSNNENEESEKLVSLPRAMILEWVSYIRKNNLTRETKVRSIRDGVIVNSKYSSHLHGFETHLKAAAFAYIESEDYKREKHNFALVAVGSDWTNNENIFGYQDALQNDVYRKPPNGALELILQAASNPQSPYFLILDEMNLSHVERYFSDILSALESGGKIALHSSPKLLKSSDDDELGVPSGISLPDNLFIIGTVNVDETTYMFSPKVLDRANVIEFRVSKNNISDFLNDPQPINLNTLAGKGSGLGPCFVQDATSTVKLDNEISSLLKDRLEKIFIDLSLMGGEFGFRTAYEITRFIYFHKKLCGESWSFNKALDAQILQKLMPKLHGSQRRLDPVLSALEKFCVDYECPESLSKIILMREKLKDGFTSFADA